MRCRAIQTPGIGITRGLKVLCPDDKCLCSVEVLCWKGSFGVQTCRMVKVVDGLPVD